MSQQPENHNNTDIVENITELMNNPQTGRINNTYNESTQHNSIQSPSISTQHYVQRPRFYVSPPSYEECTDLSKLPTYEEMALPAHTYSDFTIDDANTNEKDILGTNLTFLKAFFVACMLNWVGCIFVLLICQTVAARHGAFAGFGLSIALFTKRVKHLVKVYTVPENGPVIFICWLFIIIGSMLCIYFVVKYCTTKYRWSHLSVRERERVRKSFC